MDVEQVTVIKSGLDASGYKAGADQIVAANASIAASGDAVTQANAKVTRSLTDSGAGMERLRRQYIDGYAETAKYADLQDRLNRNFQLGRTTVDEMNQILAVAADRMGLVSRQSVELTTRIQAAADAMRAASNAQAAFNAKSGVGGNPLFGDQYAARLADLEAYGAGLDQLRAKYNPLFAAVQQYNAALDEINEAEKVGALGSIEAANARQKLTSAYRETAVGATEAAEALRTLTAAQAAFNAGAGVGGNPLYGDDYAKRHSDIETAIADADRQRASIDRVFASSKAYEAQLNALNKQLEIGNITEQAHTRILDQLNASYAQSDGPLKKNADGMKAVGDTTWQTRFATQQLGVQSVQFFTSIQAGQPILTAFIQQGHQIVDVALSTGTGFGVLGAAIKSVGSFLAGPGGLIVAGLAAVAGVVALGVATEAADSRMRGLQTALRGTRDDYTAMATQADQAARAVARSGAASLADATAAAKSFATQASFHGTQADMQALISTANDLAAVMGTKLPDEAKKLAAAMYEPGKAAQELADQHLKGMTYAMADVITRMQLGGDTAGAYAKYLDIVTKATHGAAVESKTGLEKALADLEAMFIKTTAQAGLTSTSFAGFISDQAILTVKDFTGLLKEIQGIYQWFMDHPAATIPVPGVDSTTAATSTRNRIAGMTGGSLPASTSIVPTVSDALTGLWNWIQGGGSGHLVTSGVRMDPDLTSRGIRNNNPLNLTYLPGQGASGSDGRFGVYDSMAAGINANAAQLLRYQDVYGLNTIGGIVNRWAPPGENNSGAYASSVSGSMGVGVNDQINLHDPGTMSALITAMSRVENGPNSPNPFTLGSGNGTINFTIPSGSAVNLMGSNGLVATPSNVGNGPNLSSVRPSPIYSVGGIATASTAAAGVLSDADWAARIDKDTHAINNFTNAALDARAKVKGYQEDLDHLASQGDTTSESVQKLRGEIDKQNAVLSQALSPVALIVQGLNIQIAANENLAKAWDKGAAAAADAQIHVKVLADLFAAGGAPLRDNATAVAELTKKYNEAAGASQDLALAQKSSQNRDTIDFLNAEISTIGDSVEVRNRELAVLKAAQDLKNNDSKASPERQQEIIDEAAKISDLTTAYQQQQQAMQTLGSLASNIFNTIGDQISAAFVQGQSAAVTFGNITKAVMTQVIKDVLQLALIGPISNSLFGTNQTTLGQVLSIGGSVAGGGSTILGAGASSGGGGGILGLLSNAGSVASGGSSIMQALGFQGLGGQINGLLGGPGTSLFAGTELGSGSIGTGVTSLLNTPIGASLGSSATLGTAFTGVGGGFALGSLSGSLIQGALNKTGPAPEIGAGVGALGGAAIGSFLGPGGTVIGGLLGGLLGGSGGGFIGPGPQNTFSGTQIGLNDQGQLTTGLSSNQGTVSNANATNDAVKALNDFTAATNLAVTSLGGLTQVGVGTGADKAADLASAFPRLRFSSPDPTLNDNISNRSFGSAQELQDAVNRIMQMEAALKDFTAAVANTDAASKVDEWAARFGALGLSAADYSATFTNIATFVTQTVPPLLGINDNVGSLTTQINALITQFAPAIATAKDLGYKETELTAARDAAAQKLKDAVELEIRASDEDLNVRIANAKAVLANTTAATQNAQLYSFDIAADRQRKQFSDQLIATFGDAFTATQSYADQIALLENALGAERLNIVEAGNKKIADAWAQLTTTDQGFNVRISNANATIAGTPEADQAAKLYAFDIQAEQERQQFTDQLVTTFGQAYTTTQSYAEQIALQEKALGTERLAIIKQYNDQIVQIDQTTQAALITPDQAQSAFQSAQSAVVNALNKQISSVNDQISAITTNTNALHAAADNIQKFNATLGLSSVSPLTPGQQLALAQQTFEADAAKARSDDVTAAGGLTGDASTLLETAGNYYGRATSAYQELYSKTQATLSDVEGGIRQQASVEDQQLSVLRQQLTELTRQRDTMQLIGSQIAKSIDELKQIMLDAFKALQNAMVLAGKGTAAGLGPAQVAALGGSPTDQISALYQDYLGRAPEAAGLSAWTNQLTSGQENISQIATQFASSPEAKIDALYQTYLGRAPDVAGLTSWVSQLNSGVSLADITASFAASPERQALLGHAAGGWITGGVWNKDSVAANLAGGEYVINATEAARYADILPKINSGMFANDNASASNNGAEMLAELRSLRTEVERLTRITAEAGLQVKGEIEKGNTMTERQVAAAKLAGQRAA